ncbi:MAG: hypothetical protein V1696_03990 [Candidatus Jorgensenbacteria bacterium]
MLSPSLKEKAVALRRGGLSYSEILNQIPIAKSTLSTWLHSVGLSKKQKQRLTEKKLASARRGAFRKHEIRLLKTDAIFKEAIKDIAHISERELFLIGVALYWAEGAKEKEWRPGSGVQFTNSDASMVTLFLKWLTDVCRVDKDEIYFDLFIHETSKNRVSSIIDYWSKHTNFPRNYFQHVYFKRNKLATKRKNVGDSYFGVIKVRVKTSSTLNRKIAGWTKGVIKYAK